VRNSQIEKCHFACQGLEYDLTYGCSSTNLLRSNTLSWIIVYKSCLSVCFVTSASVNLRDMMLISGFAFIQALLELWNQ